MNKDITINVNWNSKESIKQAEKVKRSLENKGYTLINQFGGLFHSVLIYTLKA